MGFMDTRGYKFRRTWSKLLVIVFTALMATPMASGQLDGDVEIELDRPAAPNPIPILSLALYPTQLQAEITVSQMDSVTFGGNATVEQMFFMDSTVTLSGVTNTGWPMSVNPQTLTFKGPGTKEFHVTVTVPPATSSLLTGNVLVSGSCKAPGLAPVVTSAGAVITVRQYHIIDVESEDPTVTLDAGETGKIELLVHNRGNGQTTVRLTVLDNPKDIRVELEHDDYTIQQEAFVDVTLRVSPNARASSGEYVIAIRAESLSQGREEGDTTTFNITVYIPSLTTRLGVGGIAAIVVSAVAAVTVAVLWKMGKLTKLSKIKPSRRQSTE